MDILKVKDDSVVVDYLLARKSLSDLIVSGDMNLAAHKFLEKLTKKRSKKDQRVIAVRFKQRCNSTVIDAVVKKHRKNEILVVDVRLICFITE